MNLVPISPIAIGGVSKLKVTVPRLIGLPKRKDK